MLKQSMSRKISIFYTAKNVCRFYGKITGNQLSVHLPVFLQVPDARYFTVKFTDLCYIVVSEVLLVRIIVGQGPFTLAVGADGVVLIFFLLPIIPFNFLPARYIY